MYKFKIERGTLYIGSGSASAKKDFSLPERFTIYADTEQAALDKAKQISTNPINTSYRYVFRVTKVTEVFEGYGWTGWTESSK